MGSQTIESQDISLGKIFDDFYIVPNYQREYVWEDAQVEQLLGDIYTEFKKWLEKHDIEHEFSSYA